ncbi:MAG: hypothetical protein BWY75_03152 [bacterium ADurb.Bin425]|nr:MAG: hypothetical protein BWY75_03152 [bacterium ADurb.Bin425]
MLNRGVETGAKGRCLAALGRLGLGLLCPVLARLFPARLLLSRLLLAKLFPAKLFERATLEKSPENKVPTRSPSGIASIRSEWLMPPERVKVLEEAWLLLSL